MSKINNLTEFCKRYFPKSHKNKTCDCYQKRRPVKLIILPK